VLALWAARARGPALRRAQRAAWGAEIIESGMSILVDEEKSTLAAMSVRSRSEWALRARARALIAF